VPPTTHTQAIKSVTRAKHLANAPAGVGGSAAAAVSDGCFGCYETVIRNIVIECTNGKILQKMEYPILLRSLDQ
jgi:hypothetical protein